MAKLYPYKIKSTDAEIFIFPISFYYLRQTVVHENVVPMPQAPLIQFDLPGGEQISEANVSDPGYQELLKRWDQDVNQAAMQRLLVRIALHQKLSDEQRAEVVELREALVELGEHPHSNDKVLFFFERVLGTDDEMQDLVQAVSKLADPDEANIQKK
jgi:hypothetical protein